MSEDNRLEDNGPRRAALEEDSIGTLLRRVPGALLQRIRSVIPDAVANALLVICGLIVLVTPLGLWVAWTTQIFFAVLIGGLIAFFIALAVIATAPDGEF